MRCKCGHAIEQHLTTPKVPAPKPMKDKRWEAERGRFHAVHLPEDHTHVMVRAKQLGKCMYSTCPCEFYIPRSKGFKRTYA